MRRFVGLFYIGSVFITRVLSIRLQDFFTRGLTKTWPQERNQTATIIGQLSTAPVAVCGLDLQWYWCDIQHALTHYNYWDTSHRMRRTRVQYVLLLNCYYCFAYVRRVACLCAAVCRNCYCRRHFQRPSVTRTMKKSVSFYRAAWNADAVLRWDFCPYVAPSVRPSVCPSVCQTRALWQNGRKICSDFYITRKNIYPSFMRKRMVGGGDPFYLKFCVNRPALERNRRFWTDNRSQRLSPTT